MKWSAKQVNQLILEMAAQAKAASWADRHAENRARIMIEILKRYGWVRRDQHPPEVCDAAVGIAFHAPGTRGHTLRLQVLGCLFADSHSGLTPRPASGGTHRRRWFRVWRMPRPLTQTHSDALPEDRVVRDQFARLLDKVLSELHVATVFGTTRPQLRRGRLIYPELCCPNDLLWLRCSLGVSEE